MHFNYKCGLGFVTFGLMMIVTSLIMKNVDMDKYDNIKTNYYLIPAGISIILILIIAFTPTEF